jgi:hypothetical protein
MTWSRDSDGGRNRLLQEMAPGGGMEDGYRRQPVRVFLCTSWCCTGGTSEWNGLHFMHSFVIRQDFFLEMSNERFLAMSVFPTDGLLSAALWPGLGH